MRKVLFACSLIILLECPAHAAPPGYSGFNQYQTPALAGAGNQTPDSVLEYYHALGFLRSNAAKLESSPGSRNPEIRSALQQIQTDAQFLQKKWMDWPRLHPNQSPSYGAAKLDRYLRTVESASRQLKDLPKKSDAEILDAVKILAADLHAKAENCRFSDDGLGKEITVTVCTKKGTQEVAGYEVWCAPVALVKFEDEHMRFPKMSSPTVMKGLAPGYYAMWLRQDRQKMPVTTQIIGGHGEKQVEIDLPIANPAPSR
jgi:hypothetical protein